MIDRDDFVGSAVLDGSIFGQIAIGSKVDIDKVHFDVGGGGTNAAAAFARYGHQSIFMGNVGRDGAGEAVLACLDNENVDSSYVEFVRGTTGCSVVLLDMRSGERTVLSCKGASGRLGNLNPADLELIAPDWVYVSSLHGDMEKLLEIFERAHALGARVMFNPGAPELAEEKKLKGLLEDVDVLLVNKAEAAQIVPGKVLGELIVRLGNYCETVLITDGVMGAIAKMGDEVWRLGVYEQVKVRDVTGAGDAFGSGFLARFADEELDLKGSERFQAALQFAAANAASVIQKVGTKAGLLDATVDLHPMPMQQVKNN